MFQLNMLYFFSFSIQIPSIRHARGLAVQHVNKLKPRFLLVSGDLTNVPWENIIVIFISGTYVRVDVKTLVIEIHLSCVSKEALGWRPSLVGWRPLLLYYIGWIASKIGVKSTPRHGLWGRRQTLQVLLSRWWLSRRSAPCRSHANVFLVLYFFVVPCQVLREVDSSIPIVFAQS